jgi:diguanylate cyclase (GGDEF)-like protein
MNHDSERVPLLPAMVVFFIVVLTLVAHKNNTSAREKLVLAMKVRDFGLRDALTGLRNRAFVEVFTEQRAAQIVEQWQNSGRRKAAPGRSLALLLVDLDHFKNINDKYGHASGDQVLASFAKVARAAVRAGDIVARWGGEEFLVVMEVDDRNAAHEVAERLRAMIATSPVPDASGRAIRMTCSIGACLFPFDPTRADELTWRETLELADSSLYRAKSKGRNRTMWAEPDPLFTPRQLLAHERDDDADTQVYQKVA